MRNKLPLILFGILILFGNSSRANDAVELTEFSKNVTLHVLFHELAHALIREFDLPVLANEEAMADTFSTIWVTKKLQDQAPDIVMARVRSWFYEDAEVSPADYDFKGEHLLDIRRAYQAACLFYGLSPADYRNIIKWLKFSKNDLADCSDTAPDQEKSWIDLLEPYQLPLNKPSQNVKLIYGDGPMKELMAKSGLLSEFTEQVRLFDWPEKIIIHFDHCDFGASWSRSKRRILLCDDYVLRFVQQGKSL